MTIDGIFLDLRIGYFPQPMVWQIYLLQRVFLGLYPHRAEDFFGSTFIRLQHIKLWNVGSGMEAPLMALQMLFQRKPDTLKYLFLGLNVSFVSIKKFKKKTCVSGARSRSERDPVAQSFMEKNFPKPLQTLVCTKPNWLKLFKMCFLRPLLQVEMGHVRKGQDSLVQKGQLTLVTQIVGDEIYWSLLNSSAGRLH